MADTNNQNKSAIAGAATQAAGAAVKAAPGVGSLSSATELVTDPKKRKWTLWGLLASCGCCILPFVIGLVIGISSIDYLCEKYALYNKWKNIIIATMTVTSPASGISLYMLDHTIDYLGSDKMQDAYNKLPDYIREQMPLSTLMTIVNSKKFLSETCGSSLNVIGGNGLPCGEIVEIGDQYVGKWVDEMQTIMTAANFQFNRTAWCAEFVAFVVEQAGYNVRDFHYPHTMNWMKKFRDGVDGWRLLAPGETPQPGDIAMQHTAGASLTNPIPGQWPHTCIVHEVISDTQFTCLGGNQGGTGRGHRMVTNDSVRSISSFVFGRLPNN